jgi:catechol 2,3-dioxygenase-like lactoylglutathione lyase family enzyme
MNPVMLEHLNLTVDNLEATTRFILTALPSWRVRGQGEMDWYGKRIAWRHVGDDNFYLALQEGGEGATPHWGSHQLGAKHVGLVVPDVAALVQRLTEAGFPLDHWGADVPTRLSAYLLAPGGFQFEFVEYRTRDLAARQCYAPA